MFGSFFFGQSYFGESIWPTQVSISGSSTGLATVTGSLKGQGALSGSSSGAAVVSGSLKGTGTLSGSSSGGATVTASILASGVLVGSTAGSSTVSAAISGGEEVTPPPPPVQQFGGGSGYRKFFSDREQEIVSPIPKSIPCSVQIICESEFSASLTVTFKESAAMVRYRVASFSMREQRPCSMQTVRNKKTVANAKPLTGIHADLFAFTICEVEAEASQTENPPQEILLLLG